METLQDVTRHAADGLIVCWKQDHYRVTNRELVIRTGNPKHWLVQCMHNGHAIGLYHANGVTSDHDPADFYILHSP